MTEWYAYKDIAFKPEQMMFLIEHLGLLREGKYPPEPVISGYDDRPIGSSLSKACASYEKPCQLAAEVEVRLERTGIDGRLLIAQVRAGNCINDLDYEARRALRYISGWRRRKMDYPAWYRQRKYRKEN